MKEENKVRFMRYGFGVLHLAVGVLILYILDLFIYETIFSVIVFIFSFMIAIASILWSAILIGRCEAFVESNYGKEKKK